MSVHDDAQEALCVFLDEGWISEVLFEVKSGKEATVYCCRAGDRAATAQHLKKLSTDFTDNTDGKAKEVTSPSSNQESQSVKSVSSVDPPGSPPLLAAKVYRSLESRRFKNDAVYQTGRMHLAREGRVKRAADSKSAFGRKVQYATWIDNEWETMHALHHAGVDLPQPITRSDRAILMPYLGDETAAAPKLNDVDPPRDEVARITDRLLWNIQLMLHHDRVHGDLSPFNILYWNNMATIIDFPQAIDPRLNPAAQPLLSRDIDNICRWAAKRGVIRNAAKITHDLWSRFVLGDIG